MNNSYPRDSLPIALRAYADGTLSSSADWENIGASEDWVLVFDTETNVDHAQTLRFGVYHVYYKDELYQKGIFYNPEIITSNNELGILRNYSATNDFEFRTREDFVEEILFKIAYDLDALIVGFNLPFDLSRLAIHHADAHGKMRGGFTFELLKNEFKPWVQIKYLSRHASIIRFRKVGAPPGRSRRKRGDKQSSSTGYFLDLGTIATALTNQQFNLKRLAEFLKTEHQKLGTDEHGAPITTEYLKYAAMDVQVTWECFVRLRERYSEHHLSKTHPHEIFSEAGLGKAYLKEMGIQPWRQVQGDFPPELLGMIMSSYFGGRSEVRLRQTITQTAYCDFTSMYPTVCTLMGLWKWVIAEGINWQDTTATAAEAQHFLDEIQLADLQNPETWQRLCRLVQVQPDDDLFSVRAKYDLLNEFADDQGNTQYTIGLNYLTCDRPLWFTMADCVAAKILTGKVPKVVKAINFQPQSPQSNLRPINIMGKSEYRVDPYQDDFYKRIIELRTQTKKQMGDVSGIARDNLNIEQGALKILANATSYGIFLQLNVDDLAQKKVVTCYGSSGAGYPFPVNNIEKPGQYFHPLIGTFITGAARLMLGLAERLGGGAGLDWIFCDTDSMAFAKPPDMSENIFYDKVKKLRSWFSHLNPYNIETEMFKLEDANFALNSDGSITQNVAPLHCLAVSAKRYVLFNLNDQGCPIIRKASAHGLGHFRPPYERREQRNDLASPSFPLDELREETGVNLWQHDVWYEIIRNNQAGGWRQNPAVHPLFNQPGVRKYAATTPELINWFRIFNKDKPYKDRVKPFNFLLAYKADKRQKPHVLLKEDSISEKPKPSIYYPAVVAPYNTDLRRAFEKCFDRKTGKPVVLDQLEIYRTALASYHLHAEGKFKNGWYEDRGLTERRHIVVTEIRNIGKEANRLEEQAELEARPEAQIEYGTNPEEEKLFFERLEDIVHKFTARAVASKANVSERQLQDIRKHSVVPRIQTRARLIRATSLLETEKRQKEKEIEFFIAWTSSQLDKLGNEKEKQKEFAEMLGTTLYDLRKMLKSQRKPSKKVMNIYRKITDDA